LATFARFNKKTIDAAMFNRLKAPEDIRLKENAINKPSATVLDLMKKPRLRRTTILLTLLWLVSNDN
jgi:hypothetical protein